LIADVFSRA